MATRNVTATGKDKDRDITKLCGSFGEVAKWTAISDIEGGVHDYRSGGDKIIVVRDSSVVGGKYLRTVADGDPKNNLDNLPDC